jgi:hypothetical protein
MGKPPQTAAEIRDNLAENLDWRVAERDDLTIAQAVYRGAAIDAVHTLDEAGLLDGFFAFLEEKGIFKHWQTFTFAGVQHIFLPAIYFVLLYGTRILFGIRSTNALPALLFSNVAVMTLIGFNAYVVVHGMTRRGAQQRTGARPYVLMDPQTLANTISQASAAGLADLFNGTIHCLAAAGVFASAIMAAVDGTRIETTRHYKGCGCLSVTRRKRTRAGGWVAVVELLFGWRLIALVDLTTLIPVAIKIVQIQEHEAPHLLDLLHQAQQNLAPYSRIATLVIDRAYVDGPTLYALTQLDIIWYLMAKSNMTIRATALALSAEGQVLSRTETVQHGHGRDATSEELVTRIIPVTGLRTWDSYRPPHVAGQRLAFNERPALNAVVIAEWQSQPPDEEGARVILTNGPLAQPWDLVDAYDDRSWIENGLFRNSKQFWTLTRWFPKKTAAGVRAHLTFVMLMVATATTYRLWDQAHHALPKPTPAPHLARPRLPQVTTEPEKATLAHGLLEGQGCERWRRELRQQQRDKLIVFIGEAYGIFETHEFLVLAHVPVHHLPAHLGTPEDVLRRFECLSAATADSNVKERSSVQDTIP